MPSSVISTRFKVGHIKREMRGRLILPWSILIAAITCFFPSFGGAYPLGLWRTRSRDLSILVPSRIAPLPSSKWGVMHIDKQTFMKYLFYRTHSYKFPQKLKTHERSVVNTSSR